MTVQELIDELNKIQDKSAEVHCYDSCGSYCYAERVWVNNDGVDITD